MDKPIFINNNTHKIYCSKDYNYSFDKRTGFFVRFGKDKHDDPIYAPFPELLDIEISTICNNGCKACYKGNTPNGKNMTFDDFVELFDKFPETLTQIAFGIGDINSNLDLFKILHYTRNGGVIPNITINGNGLTDDIIEKLKICGAIAVSLYDKETCYNAVYRLSQVREQVNIHVILSNDNVEKIYELLVDIKNDKRLEKLNAIVFLKLKPKGLRNDLGSLYETDFTNILNCCLDNNISFGADSCSAPDLMRLFDKENKERYKDVIESCESTLFSGYINVNGEFFPCSFVEGEMDWKNGIKISQYSNFKEVWFHEKLEKFRTKLISTIDDNGCRNCPIKFKKSRNSKYKL